MTKNEQFVTDLEKFVNEQFSEFGANSQNQEMSLFTKVSLIEVGKIKI